MPPPLIKVYVGSRRASDRRADGDRTAGRIADRQRPGGDAVEFGSDHRSARILLLLPPEFHEPQVTTDPSLFSAAKASLAPKI
jgi:hypothetical protein